MPIESKLELGYRLGLSPDDPEEGDGQEIFNSGVLNIDWSIFSLARSSVETILTADIREIDLGGGSIHALYVKTDAPVLLEFTQDAETRRFTVFPSVYPLDYFTSSVKTPSDKPAQFQYGTFLATGSPITALSIKGIANVKVVANVLIAFAGYR